MSRRTNSVLAALLAIGALTACSDEPEELPTPEAEEATDRGGPILDDDTMQAVLEDIAATVDEADAAQDPSLLSDRVMGPAARLRSAEYRIADATDGAIQTDPLSLDTQVSIVGSSPTYPRVAMAVSEIPDGENLPLLLTLATSDVRDNFRLWSWVQLFPGVTVPETLSPEIGAETISSDDDSLVATPDEVVAAYAELIADPEADHDLTFLRDDFRYEMFSQTAELNSAVSAAGTATLSAEAIDDGPLALQTVDGGAIVVGVIETTTTVTKTDEDGTLNIGGVFADLLGNDGAVENEVQAVAEVSVAFYVPPADAEDASIEVLGASSVLSEALANGESVVLPSGESATDGESSSDGESATDGESAS
jgi:hypothetical protein